MAPTMLRSPAVWSAPATGRSGGAPQLSWGAVVTIHAWVRVMSGIFVIVIRSVAGGILRQNPPNRSVKFVVLTPMA